MKIHLIFFLFLLNNHFDLILNLDKMDMFHCFILDEVSMVSDNDLSAIEEYICDNNKKIIIIGDNCQIPSPSQHIVVKGDICYKADSYAFDMLNECKLTQIVRQAKDSDIIKIASYIRDNINETVDLENAETGC